MELEILEYDKKWIKLGLINQIELEYQFKEFETGDDTKNIIGINHLTIG